MIEDSGCPCELVPANLEIEAECRYVVATCESRFGEVHGLVNAAGLTTRGFLEDTSVELWDLLFAVNVRAPFILTQEVVRLMKHKKNRGSIVNIATFSSYGGQPYLTAYCASKGALVTFTKNIAHSLRHDLIRVNALNIGWMDTPNEDIVQRTMGAPNNWLEMAEAGLPFGRLPKPIEVAKLTAYLLSDEAEMMTGSIIDFDQNIMGAYG